MGINFGSTTPASAPTAAPAATPTPAPVTVAAPGGGVTLDLSKGNILDLTKESPGLVLCKLAAGWDAAVAAAAGIDLDLSAILLNENEKITGAEDVVFFKHMEVPGVKLNGDNRTGDGEGDDETISIDLSKINGKYKSIVFVVNIFDAMTKKQTFGMVQNSYVRLLDEGNGGKEICRFRLKDEYANSTAVIFAKLSRGSNGWQFESIGDGKVARDLNDILNAYL